MLNIASVTPAIAIDCLETAYKLDTPLMLWGAPGLGKSSIVREFALKHGLEFYDVRLTQKERGDFAVPYINTETKTLDLYLTNQIPFDGKPSLLFFDEISNCEPSVQVVIYEILLDRRLAGRPITNCFMVAAGNRPEDGCSTYEMNSAAADRMTHIQIEADCEGWLKDWAPANGIHPVVMTFLKTKPQFFNSGAVVKGEGKEGKSTDVDNLIKPTPRSWAEVSKIISLGSSKAVEYALIAGRIGAAVAAELRLVTDELNELPAMDQLFEASTDKETLELLKRISSPSGLYGLVYSVFAYAKNIPAEPGLMRAGEIFNLIVKVQDSLPRSEVQTMGMDMVMQELINRKAMTKLITSPVFKNYQAKHSRLTKNKA